MKVRTPAANFKAGCRLLDKVENMCMGYESEHGKLLNEKKLSVQLSDQSVITNVQIDQTNIKLTMVLGRVVFLHQALPSLFDDSSGQHIILNS